MPAVASANWLNHARAYYVAEQLGILDAVHPKLFEALHGGERPANEERRPKTERELQKFFSDLEVDEEEFTRLYRSAEVDELVKKAYLLGKDYRLTGVPSMVVNGRYVTSPMMAGTAEASLTILNQLIEKERVRMASGGMDMEATEETN